MPAYVNATWEDVPHLDDQAKADLLQGMRPHEREARSKGIPSLGAGAIYPVPESVWVCEPFALPEWWSRAYGLDVGWNRTAALWGAFDAESDTVYVYSEHYLGQGEPSVHADAIKARGDWLWGAIDPAANGRTQTDGKQLLAEYRALGLNLKPADNAVEAGIHKVHQRLATARIRIFSTCVNTVREMRIYRRDENGKVVKEHDHAMDALRYLIMTGMRLARVKPVVEERHHREAKWDVVNDITGY